MTLAVSPPTAHQIMERIDEAIEPNWMPRKAALDFLEEIASAVNERLDTLRHEVAPREVGDDDDAES